MATPNNRLSLAMERTGQWVFSQDIPTDVIVEVGETIFSLHKFMLVAKSNYIRKLILESNEGELTRIYLSDIPGGPSIFEKTAKFCYGVNFEITVHNVAVLRCAAEFLQMTDQYCENNLAGRTEEFLIVFSLGLVSIVYILLTPLRIATLIPKSARKIDDDLYRAVDIYLKAHPKLDEIEREKVCSVMDPLKLSYEARVHASQNKRLPVQIVLHALYYDQLRLRSGAEEREVATEKNQLQMDVTLNKNTNNDANPQGHGTTSSATPKKATFFSSVSKTLGKLNPFRNGSKDTTHLEDASVDLTKPRRRRFSMS
ncbi:Root phototropism protein 2 [Glycine soja]|uniref:Root phototropism protein 2 n=1 Tax=Glycine soja TaxID=3848 RepID=A0A0B2QFU0_GLYSO|nr:Root phototropism protein 2 [Glycine soja]